MTSVAMIAGMIPVAAARGDGAEQRVGMALAIIGSLVASTVLTLVVVPVIYSLFDGLRSLCTRQKIRGGVHATGGDASRANRNGGAAGARVAVLGENGVRAAHQMTIPNGNVAKQGNRELGFASKGGMQALAEEMQELDAPPSTTEDSRAAVASSRRAAT